MAVGFGVQGPCNRERDFTRGSATQFIVVGLTAACRTFTVTALSAIEVYRHRCLLLAAESALFQRCFQVRAR